MGRVMTGETPVPSAEIKATAEKIRALLSLDVAATPGDLLPELAMLDQAEQDVRTARDLALVEVRRRGVSWNSIEAQTGVPATTWRGRHFRFTEEASTP